MVPDKLLLPIKVVIPDRRDYVRPPRGGGKRKIFGTVDQFRRKQLDDQIGEIKEYFSASFRTEPGVPAVARVLLKDNALAKSHRPIRLFDEKTWPIIGAGNFGELLVSVRPKAMERLSRRFLQPGTEEAEANLSTIESIEPYRREDALKAFDFDSIAGSPDKMKFRLFHHNDSTLDANLQASFLRHIEKLGVGRPKELRYGGGLRIYRLPKLSAEQTHNLASFVGTQSLSQFPVFHSVRTQAITLRAARVGDFPAPDPEVTYPLVGIVDSGVEHTSPLIGPWIEAREEYVIESKRDYSHGTFVAGLICNAHNLNHNDVRFPQVKSKIVDVVAMPSTGGLTEDQLLAILEEVVPKHPDVEVWNLSLGKSDPPCADGYFSDLAVALDELQNTHGVTFVFAAGNYTTIPLRSWPPNDLGEDDRICPPADSARGITVSSLAHEDRPDSAVKKEQPAPYSRRGPGAAFLPKPDLAHYGGNCTEQLQCNQTGVLSLDANDNLSEDVGTSFATPLVSTLLANVINAFQTPPSRCLAKALLIHSAVLESEPLTAQALRYRGFGVPGDMTSILSCSPWSATLIFEPEIVPTMHFVKDDFPIPDCLRTPEGKVFGEFIMTVVCEPALNAQFGAEYCRINVEASLGTYDPDNEDKCHHAKKIPEEPKDINDMYERQLVEHGFKWSPVKVYRRLIPNGIQGDQWRLLVKAQRRVNHSSDAPTPTAILVTIRDNKRMLPVYDQVVRNMATSGWITEDIKVEERVRMRFST